MRFASFASALTLLLLCGCPRGSTPSFSVADEIAFRRLRQDFHRASTTGDQDLMRGLWADDAVLTTLDGVEIVGGEAITNFISADPAFGMLLVLTVESSWNVAVRGNTAEYGFESVAIDLGGEDPGDIVLSSQGSQNPAVAIVEHTHSTGTASRQANGRWVFKELTSGRGPLGSARQEFAVGSGVTAIPLRASASNDGVTLVGELGFRRMRETFHLANLIGDVDLMRSVWADDAVFTTGGGSVFVGGDAIVEFFATRPSFGRRLILTPESSSRLVIDGETAEYGFECIGIDVGGNDPKSTELGSPDGSQNPAVEIVSHTNSTGIAVRLADGRWAFKEFNGAAGPLSPAPEGLVGEK